MSQVYVGNGSGGGGPSTDLHVARYIVSAGGTTDGANYTTIQSAITAAALTGVDQTVAVQPGTYTENLTLAVGVNIVAFDADAQTPNVIVIGKATATFTGASSLSGIDLRTNADYVLEVTGSNSTVINFYSCNFTLTNANAIHCTNSNALINLYDCFGSTTSSQTYFIFTGGGLNVFYCVLTSNNSTTASTFANASISVEYSAIYVPITTSGTGGAISAQYCFFTAVNTTSITANGTSSSFFYFNRVETGTASAISIGAGATLPVLECAIYSTNTNAITGAGTVQFGEIDFYGAGASSGINTSTITALNSRMGALTLTNPLTVPNGGTGDSSFTAYSVVCGGTTSTGALQNVSGVGSSGEVLTSNGAAALPTWQAAGGGGSSVYFQAYSTTNQTVAGGNTSTTIIFDSAVTNVGSAYNAGTGVFTAPTTGFYGFSVCVFFDDLTTPAGLSQIILGYTGSVQSLRLQQTGLVPATTGPDIIVSAGWEMAMTAGDTVQIQPFADGTGNYIIAGGSPSSSTFSTASTFSGFKIA
jgi:hypothetical protein